MSDPDTTDGSDRTDTVVETHTNRELDVTAKEVLRTGFDGEEHEFVKIYGTRTERYGALDGGGETEVERDVKLAEFPEDVTTEVLFGLAELHGYRLEAK